MTSYLVTGGTGSFGQAFVRRVLEDADTTRVVVYSRDECKQVEMARSLADGRLRFFIGDVRDADRLHRALSAVDTIVHAAALKHVPVAEYNPSECIKTNIGGAQNVIDAAIDCGVARVLCLSTDKAVCPVNLYGASKLAAEKLFVAANHLAGGPARSRPRFAVVRYGNVVGSRGSVVPFFKLRSADGVLPITDPRMTRFWLTLDQGVDFVRASLARMKGGEVFVPKLPATRITDLASAVAPGCRHEVIGIRPGEKLHETLISAEEARHTHDCGDCYVIYPAVQEWGPSEREGIPVPADFAYTSERAADARHVNAVLGACQSMEAA